LHGLAWATNFLAAARRLSSSALLPAMLAAYSPLDQILDAVWKETAFVSPRSADVYVRKLCSRSGEPCYLRTLRGAGYSFEAPKK
jgi:DNA-binding response OmpR family regulator